MSIIYDNKFKLSLLRHEDFFEDSLYIAPILLGDPEEVDYFQYSKSVYYEQDNEPHLVVLVGGRPEGKSFPKYGPHQDGEEYPAVHNAYYWIK